MFDREEIRAKAKAAINKKAAIGPDINLDEFDRDFVPHEYMADEAMCAAPVLERARLLLSGIDVTEQERSGTYYQKDTSVVHCDYRQGDIEVIPIRKALEKYDWINEYYWKLVAVDTDKYTASSELELHDGYFIRALPGSKSVYPVQTCLYLEKEGIQQNVHNIIVAEEGSELHVITGCTTASHLKKGLHVGVSEFFVKKNAKLSFTMIHNWAEDMMVRPRSVIRVDEGGLYLNNYICMKPVKSIQMYPSVYLNGKDAVARLYSIIVGSPNSEYDVGGRVYLKAPGTRAEIIARTISNGGTIISRGDLVGEVAGIKAHLECRGLLLNGGVIHAIPELRGYVDGVEMSHEAAVGKIAQEEINYLMSRGLSADEATATIVRGFLNVDMPELPGQLRAEIDKAIAESEKELM